MRAELAHPRYRCAPLVLGINTDAYQPIERKLGLTRQLLEVLVAARHPVSLITKSALIERDLDLLGALARDHLIQVQISLTTLDHSLARHLEPRATAPLRRLETIQRLREAGIPVGILLAPVIPFLNDAELERILERTRAAGALDAGYVFIRLPREVATLFTDWLRAHYPLKANRVLERIHDAHGGRDYESEFGTRMRGRGVYADLIAARFRTAHRRLEFPGMPALDCSAFEPPAPRGPQLSLF
ncbi:MAG: radical SAM protein [Thiotrichales bacterium]